MSEHIGHSAPDTPEGVYREIRSEWRRPYEPPEPTILSGGVLYVHRKAHAFNQSLLALMAATPVTFREVATVFGVSSLRIRQRIEKAMETSSLRRPSLDDPVRLLRIIRNPTVVRWSDIRDIYGRGLPTVQRILSELNLYPAVSRLLRLRQRAQQSSSCARR